MINFTIITKALPFLLRGLLVSLQIALCSGTIGIIFGTLLAFVQASGITILNYMVGLYVGIIRGTPMLIQIWFAYYILPQMGISISPFWTAVLAIGMNSSAYISQTVRSGIQSVAKGQLEAAHVLGLNRLQTVRYIILPQALAIVLPALGNEFVTLVKDSSLASIIGVAELSKEGRLVIQQTYDALSVFTIMALLYLIITSSVSFIIYKIEQRMRAYARH